MLNNEIKEKTIRQLVYRYDFAYAGRDTVNTGLVTFSKMAPALINKASYQIDKTAKRRSYPNRIVRKLNGLHLK